MPRKRTLSLRCPTCKKLVLRSDPEFPFCSERCRLIDLGRWASEGYVISTPITDPEAFESDPREDGDRGRRNDSGEGPPRRKPQ
ncbi:MAG TPA: DNA gyrase inhibitor YacG [Terriglobales bacterium]|nr:DNA gyrase inhibitor YacG [Terriglobales bacterium]